MSKRKQQQILKTAEMLFNRFGIKKTAVDDIARDARVAKATIYNYFGNKEGLLKALVTQKIQQFESTLLALTSSDTSPIDTIKALIREHVQLFKDNPFINDPVLQDNELKDELNKKEAYLLQNIVQHALQKGLIVKADSNQIINTFLLMLKGIESTLKNRINASLDSIDESVDLLSSMFFKANKINGGNNGTA